MTLFHTFKYSPSCRCVCSMLSLLCYKCPPHEVDVMPCQHVLLEILIVAIWFYSGVKLQKTVKYYSAAFSMMLDHSSQSKEQKWSQPTWKQNKELFVNTFSTINWSRVIKIACVEKEWSQNNSDIQLVSWLYAFMSAVSDSSCVAIDPGISLCTPLTTYLCLWALVSHIAQGEKQESFFNANDIARGRAQPKAEAAWMQILHFHLFPFPSAPVPGQCYLP